MGVWEKEQRQLEQKKTINENEGKSLVFCGNVEKIHKIFNFLFCSKNCFDSSYFFCEIFWWWIKKAFYDLRLTLRFILS